MQTYSRIALSMLLAACGPKEPGESNETSGTSGDAESTTSEPASTSTGEPTTSGSPTSATVSSEPAPTVTGEPEGACPEGQPSLSPLWAAPLAPQLPGAEVQLMTQIGRLGDGRLAIAALISPLQTTDFAPAVLWLAADGAPLGMTVGAGFAGQDLSTRALAVDTDDTVVMVGDQMLDDTHAGWIARFAPEGPELSRATIAGELDQPRALALDGQAIVLGHRRSDHGARIARVDITTGAAQWERVLPTTSIIAEPRVAIGPDDAIIAARGAWSSNAPSELTVWRMTPTGQPDWELQLSTAGVGHGKLGGLVLTPDGQIVLLAVWEGSNPRVVAISQGLVDASPKWMVEVTGANADGGPRTYGAVVDDGSLAIPIARGPEIEAGGRADPMTAELHRISLAGGLQSVTPLTLQGLPTGNARFAPLLGACGELILLHAEDINPWIGAFAP